MKQLEKPLRLSEGPGPETVLHSYLVEMVVEILGVNAVIQVESPVREKEFVVRTWESVTQGIR